MSKLLPRQCIALALLLLLPGPFDPACLGAPTETHPGPYLRLETGGHTGTVWRVRFSPDGKELYSAGEDKTVRVWRVAEGSLSRTLRLPIGEGSQGQIYALDVSPNGQWVSTGGFGFSGGRCYVYLIDSQSGIIQSVGKGHTNVVLDLAFSPNGERLASASADGSCRIWAVSPTGQLTLESLIPERQSGFEAIEWLSDGQTIALGSEDGMVSIWNCQSSASVMIRSWSVTPGRLGDLDVDPNDRFLVSGSWDGAIGLWEISTGIMSRVIGRQEGPVHAVSLSADGKRVATTSGSETEAPQVFIWSTEGAALGRFDKHDGTVLDVAWAPGNGNLIASAGGVQNQIYLFRASDTELMHELVGGGGTIFSLATNLQRIAWGRTIDWDGQNINAYGPLEYALDTRHNHVSDLAVTDVSWTRAVVTRGDLSLSTGGNGSLLHLKDHSGHRTIFESAHAGEKIHSYTILEDQRIAVGTSHGLYTLGAEAEGPPTECIGHEGEIRCLASYDDGRILLSAGVDQTIRFWDAAQSQLLMSFYADRSGDWIAWTPDGHFQCSPNGDWLIGWQLNNGIERSPTFHVASRFRHSLERVDLLDGGLPEMLARMDHWDQPRATPPHRDPEAVTIRNFSQVSPPSVRILTPTNGTRVTTPEIALSVLIEPGPSHHPIEDFTVITNGRPTTQGVERGVQAVIRNQTSHEVFVGLQPGPNTVSVLARNSVAESDPATIQVLYETTADRQPLANRATVAMNLYLLAVGISDYKQESLKLRTGSSDAERIAGALADQEGLLFETINTMLITDHQATREQILRGLDWIERSTTQYDVAVIYLSGHGWQDEMNDYYFLPVDAEVEEASIKAILWSRFLKTVRGVSSRARTVFFLDTCHAGGVTGVEIRRRSPLDASKLVRDLSQDVIGAVVLCAASGRHMALESPSWGGGAFTSALVRGLDGDGDLNEDGQITMKELDFYVSDTVKRLTDGRQHTVSGWPTTLTDFPIAVTRP